MKYSINPRARDIAKIFRQTAEISGLEVKVIRIEFNHDTHRDVKNFLRKLEKAHETAGKRSIRFHYSYYDKKYPTNIYL